MLQCLQVEGGTHPSTTFLDQLYRLARCTRSIVLQTHMDNAAQLQYEHPGLVKLVKINGDMAQHPRQVLHVGLHRTGTAILQAAAVLAVHVVHAEA